MDQDLEKLPGDQAAGWAAALLAGLLAVGWLLHELPL